MRKVQVSISTPARDELGKYVMTKNPHGEQYTYETVDLYIGSFVGYGTDYEEFETNAVQVTVAIVEKDDGTVSLVPLCNIRFIASECP